MDDIFKDLVVVELASVLAGPAIGMFFAELGAKVIKIENARTNGDVTRTWKIKGEETDHPAAYYYAINYKKETHLLDLKNEGDAKKVRNFIENADIVISNFSDKSAEKLGVAYSQIVEYAPQIIYAQLVGFARNDDRPAYDIVLQAESGFLSMSGISTTKLTRMPVALIDILAAHQLKEGILIALLKKAHSGKGSYLKTSLEESAIASLANQATNYLMVNHIPSPMGTQHPNIAPYGDIFTTKDKKRIVLAIGSDKQFQHLCSILNKEQMADNALYKSNEDRVKNRATLCTLLSYAIEKIESSDLLSQANKLGVPMGLVKNLKEVFESETAQKLILEEKHDEGFTSRRVKSFVVNEVV